MPTYDVRFEASNDIAGANNRQKREVKEIIEYSLPTFIDKNNRSGTLVKKTLVRMLYCNVSVSLGYLYSGKFIT